MNKLFRFNKGILKVVSFTLVTAITLSSIPLRTAYNTHAGIDYTKEKAVRPWTLTTHSAEGRIANLSNQSNLLHNLSASENSGPIGPIAQTEHIQHLLHDDYILAVEQLEQGNFAQALSHVKNCISLYASLDEDEKDESLLAHLWFLRGYLNAELGGYEEALADLDKFFEIQVADENAYALTLQAHELKLQIYEAMGMYKEMCASLDSLIAHAGEEDETYTFNLWVVKCKLHHLLGEYDEFFTASQKVLELNAGYSEIYPLLAQVYASLEQYESMCAVLEEYLEIEPDNEYIFNLLQEFKSEESHEPEQEFIQAPQEPEEESAEQEYYLGLGLLLEDNFAEAEERLSRAIAISPEYEGLYYHRGVCRITLEDYRGAAEDFLISAQQGYMAQQSYYNRGVSLIMADEYELGLEAITMAAGMDSDEKTKTQAESFLAQIETAEKESLMVNLLSMAQVSADLNDLDSMCLYLEEYLLLAPDDASVKTILAHAKFAGAKYTEAIELYQKLLETDTAADVAYYYGLAAMQLLDFETAGEMFSKAASEIGEVTKVYPSIYYYRGVCRMSGGDYEGAVADFNESYRINEMGHGSLFNRGVCRLMLDEYDQGMRDVKAAAQMNEDKEIKAQAVQLIESIEVELEAELEAELEFEGRDGDD